MIMRTLIFTATLLAAVTAVAQKQDRIELREARFKTGDNKSWASPGFNDKDWKIIKTNTGWESQGFADYNGYAWYRIHFVLPSALKKEAFWKDSLRIFLARIDDADEVFLNGTLIAKDGSFPSDAAGYDTKWNQWREYHLSTGNSLLRWDKENILAIKVYDGGGPGGLFSASPYINMMDIIDGIRLETGFDPDNEKRNQLFVRNIFDVPISGTLKISVVNPGNDSIYQSTSVNAEVLPHTSMGSRLKVDPGARQEVRVLFTEKNTGRSVSLVQTPPYILTPKPSPHPRINGAFVFGVRPGSPFLYKIAATGERPMQYAVENLPAGLKLDASSGIITGSIDKAGPYKLLLTVSNSLGSDKKELLVKCGSLLALTPPMGWNSWNCWGLSVSDTKLRASAQALIDKGLADHGWTYMNIDDGWEAPQRNEKGEIITNSKFPDMKSLGDWLHGRGLKFGIYSSPGPTTCGGYLGSYQHELQDAVTYDSWGIDYLKYDWCSYQTIHGGKDSSLFSYKKPYEVMRKALRAQQRDIVYSLCQYGMKNVWQWGHEVDGNCWRTTGDIEDTWESLRDIGFGQQKMSPYAQPGRWNDPDMLIVGMVGWGENLHPSRLTPDEQYTHISLWCLLSAPLLIGCDISRMDAFTLNLLSNDEVIALDQDPMGKQARQLVKKEGYQVWVKELSDGNRAVGLFNLTEKYQSVSLSMKELGWEGKRRVRDCWRQSDLGAVDSFETRIPPHGVTLVKVFK